VRGGQPARRNKDQMKAFINADRHAIIIKKITGEHLIV